jgi:hypothetical protein
MSKKLPPETKNLEAGHSEKNTSVIWPSEFRARRLYHTRELYMSIKPPFIALEIKRSSSGFYEGHSVEIALFSKAIMVGLVLWALMWPANANGVLGSLNGRIL